MEQRFSNWFQKQVLRSGMNQREFALRYGFAPSTVNAWYRGQRVPDPPAADKLADALGADPDIVLALAGHRPATEPLDPDDPRNELIGMIKRIEEWPPLSFDAIHNQLESILTWQKAQRKGKR